MAPMVLIITFSFNLCAVFCLQVVLSCVLHIIQKSRYITSNCSGIFFRVEHNARELEVYCMAFCQLRAILYLAKHLLENNEHWQLHALDNEDLSRRFVNAYTSMHKGCFYGRCLGFQVSTVALGQSLHSCMFINASCSGYCK